MQRNLQDWVEHIKKQHRQSMDLGLERVKTVAKRLNLLNPHHPILIVGGTNGKGSTVAGLEAVYLAAGYKVGAFTSPYLYRFNELVRIEGENASDEDFIRAFEKIEQARADITLTQFEFDTLAALYLFREHQLDVGILEVGLGGRLDAVNMIDADVSVVTSIAIDHADWLGDTRDKIAIEKAGIFRSGKPAVCGDIDPPVSLQKFATENFVPLFRQGQQFGFEQQSSTWTWWSEKKRLKNLPLPQLMLQNMSSVLMVVELMQEKLSVKREAIDQAMREVHLAGRIQIIPGDVTTILDVSHNPAAAFYLENFLKQNPGVGKSRAVFSMLADKDIIGTIAMLQEEIDEWYIAPLSVERGASLSMLEYCFRTRSIDAVFTFPSIKNAYAAANKASEKNDRIVVFGSFYTVADVYDVSFPRRRESI